MHWRVPNMEEVDDDDWVGLFDKHVHAHQHNLQESSALASANVRSKSTSEGVGWSLVSSVVLNYTDEMEAKSACHLYHLVYVSKKRVLASNCLRKEPFWMNEMAQIIGNVPLTQLMLPGSHESGAVRRFEGYFADIFYNRYSVSQDESIWNQLVWGVRYLDLRTHFDKQTFSIVHNAINFQSLSHVLRQVERFLSESLEVVVVHMRSFEPEMSDKVDDERRHRRLADFLVNEVGHLMYPYHPLVAPHVTLEACQRIGRRLILVYQHEALQRQQPLFWPSIHVLWSVDSVSPGALQSFLNASYERTGLNRDQMVVSMAHLSLRRDIMYKDANPLDVADTWRSGIRHMANALVNRIEHWFEFHWWRDANIVAFDFVLSNDMVAVSQRVNYRRFICGLFNSSADNKKSPATSSSTTLSSSSVSDFQYEAATHSNPVEGRTNNQTISNELNLRAKIAMFSKMYGNTPIKRKGKE